MHKSNVPMLEMEFDIRCPPAGKYSHILSHRISGPAVPFDVAVCTEVIEHQMYPLSLLVGLNRLIRTDGTLYLTTNRVSFIGDILKLAIGRHNVEPLGESHVLTDYLWRPHIRLYTLDEMKQLMQLAGFTVHEGYYFDNGNVYDGIKGFAMSVFRGMTSQIPHLQSHMFIAAWKTSEPTLKALTH
ncbi:MAG: class I SAM-dependent methyltransferase [Chloroflexota bacterium]|nr:class I SAM-dependent methyltransferase [Chloroflexota bacterium]